MRQGRSSRTALAVAAYFLFLAREERFAGLWPAAAVESTARLLDAALPPLYRWNLRLQRRSWVRAWTWRQERRFMPGSILHLGVRKRYVEDQVRAALAGGCGRLVALGAGFDALPARLAAERPGLPCLELDHPATHAVKRRALEAAGLARPNLTLIGADLGTVGLSEALASAPSSPQDRPTVFTAEGLLMYLPPEAVRRLLEATARLGGPGSRLVFTHLEATGDGVPSFGRRDRLLRLRLRMAGEPLRWGVPGRELAAFLEGCGLQLVERPGLPELRRRYLGAHPSEPLMGFEHLAVARVP